MSLYLMSLHILNLSGRCRGIAARAEGRAAAAPTRLRPPHVAAIAAARVINPFVSTHAFFSSSRYVLYALSIRRSTGCNLRAALIGAQDL